MTLDAVKLSGRWVDLIPTAPEHHDGLVRAVEDGELWQLWYTGVPKPQAIAAHIDLVLGLQAKGSMLPFTVFDKARGCIAGMTLYTNIDVGGPRLEIGGTWYGKSSQRTPLNTEAKLLLLTHAFEALDCLAVEFRVHFMNHQSRRAVERLGAKLDGVLRQHKRMPDGTLRDTCVYSIISPEWPAVRSNLRWNLALAPASEEPRER